MMEQQQQQQQQQLAMQQRLMPLQRTIQSSPGQFNPLLLSQGQASSSRNIMSDPPNQDIPQYNPPQFLCPVQNSNMSSTFRNQIGRSNCGPIYVQGSCAKRVKYYMLRMKERPRDNNIEFWKNVVAEFYAPDAKKRWCTSAYTNKWKEDGFHFQDKWACRLCEVRPTYGFEGTTENLPSLLKVRYDSEIIFEQLYLEEAVEYQTASGLILLSSDKVTQEIVFQNVSLVRKAKLRVIFSPDLKIFLWEFCAWNNEEFIPRRPMNIPMVSQIGESSQNYLGARNYADMPPGHGQPNNFENIEASSSANCGLTKGMQASVGGYSTEYIRRLQMEEIFTYMTDLMDYSLIHGTSPRESMVKYVEEFKLSRMHNTGNQLQQQQQLQLQEIPPNSQHTTQSQRSRPAIDQFHSSIRSNSGQQMKKQYSYRLSKGLELVSHDMIRRPQFQSGNSSAVLPLVQSLASSSLEEASVPSAWVILQPPSLTANQLHQSNCYQMGRENNLQVGGHIPSTGVLQTISNNELAKNMMIESSTSSVVPDDPSSVENIFPAFESTSSGSMTMFLDSQPQEDDFETQLLRFLDQEHTFD